MGVRVKNQTISEVEKQGAFVASTIERVARNADSIATPNQGISSGVITFEMRDAGIDPTVFEENSGEISMSEGLDSPISLHNDRVTASSVLFENTSQDNSPGIVTYTFTLTHVGAGVRNEYVYEQTFQGSVSLR